MVSAQRNRGASVIAFTTQRSMLLPLLLPRSHKQRSIQRMEMCTISMYICFDGRPGRPVIFNTHTILLTKSISSLSHLKSNNYKKSEIIIQKTTKTMMMMKITATIAATTAPWRR